MDRKQEVFADGIGQIQNCYQPVSKQDSPEYIAKLRSPQMGMFDGLYDSYRKG